MPEYANLDEAAKAIVAAYQDAQQPALPDARTLTAQQFREARSQLLRPPPRQYPPVMQGRLARDLSPTEYAQAIQQLKLRR